VKFAVYLKTLRGRIRTRLRGQIGRVYIFRIGVRYEGSYEDLVPSASLNYMVWDKRYVATWLQLGWFEIMVGRKLDESYGKTQTL